jgi:Flp pilus assembly protein TadG
MLNSRGLIRGHLRDLLSQRARGVAAVEFAFIAPVMVLMVIGVFDVTKLMILRQEVYNTAHTIPLSASILAVQLDKTTSLTPTQANQTMSSIFAEMPGVRSGVDNGGVLVIMSSVAFLPTPSTCVSSPTVTCNYTANIAWSYAYQNANIPFQFVLRPCGVVNQVSPTAYGNSSNFFLLSLPTAGITNPDPILVVDVLYDYKPLFASFFTGTIAISATGFWPVRSIPSGVAMSAAYTKFDINNTLGGLDGIYKCSGFS